MPTEDKTWFRNYAVYYKDDPARIEAIEQLITVVQNEQNLSRTDALKTLFDAGVDMMAKDPRYGRFSLDKAISESRLFHAIVLEAQRQQERIQAYQYLGPLGILELAGELGIDQQTTERVLEACRQAAVPGRKLPPMQAYRIWILDHLKDGQEHRREGVIQAAVEEGILPAPQEEPEEHEKALNIFQQAASAVGASGGKRGWWQLPWPEEKKGKKEEPF